MISRGWIAVFSVMLLGEVPAFGCPYCQSEVGAQVAAGIFNDEFWQNFVLTLMPIPVLLLIVGVIHFGLPWPKQPADALNCSTNGSDEVTHDSDVTE